MACRECERRARELEKARRQIQGLRRRLRAALAACYWWMARAGVTLSKTGGVPRGEWGYNLGVNEAAAHIAAVLEAGDE